MIPIQPPFILKYFNGQKRVARKSGFYRRFYLSWEDALWHLLSIYRVEPGTKILLPEFFCGNVVDHMIEHGLSIFTYPVDKDLYTQTQDFIKRIKVVNPGIVVIFHPVGISNHLMGKSDKWIKYFDNNGIIIEDCVHQIIDQDNISFVSERHFLIDSLRKVVPIQGSYLYSSTQTPAISLTRKLLTLPHRLSVTASWIKMQANLVLAYFSKSKKQSDLYNLKAEAAMLTGYLEIGSKEYSSPGMSIMSWLSSMIAVDQIRKSKDWQAKKYIRELQGLTSDGLFWLPRMNEADYQNLRGFPLIINLKIADKFLKHLRGSGVLVRFELDDSLWSKGQKIVYLPMGIHLDEEDIEHVSRLSCEFLC